MMEKISIKSHSSLIKLLEEVAEEIPVVQATFIKGFHLNQKRLLKIFHIEFCMSKKLMQLLLLLKTNQLSIL